jgi:hypothetical protein
MPDLSVPAGVPAKRARRRGLALAMAMLAGLAGLAAGLSPVAVMAQGATHYQVELVIFIQPEGSAERRPLPRSAPSLDAADPDPARDAAPGLEGDAALPSGTEAPGSLLPEGFTRARLPLVLEAAAARLNRGGYQLLWHQAWVQPPTDRGAIQLPLLAALGQGPASADLSGGIQLSAARFLHLALDLELQSAGVPAAELRQRRRVRTSVQQYYDHPHIGVIAIVTPVVIDPDQSSSP